MRVVMSRRSKKRGGDGDDDCFTAPFRPFMALIRERVDNGLRAETLSAPYKVEEMPAQPPFTLPMGERARPCAYGE